MFSMLRAGRALATSASNASYKMPPEMIKAREQFRIKNALLGLGLFGFAGFIYSYSLMAVKQDDFSDIDKERPAAIEQSK